MEVDAANSRAEPAPKVSNFCLSICNGPLSASALLLIVTGQWLSSKIPLGWSLCEVKIFLSHTLPKVSNSYKHTCCKMLL